MQAVCHHQDAQRLIGNYLLTLWIHWPHLEVVEVFDLGLAPGARQNLETHLKFGHRRELLSITLLNMWLGPSRKK